MNKVFFLSATCMSVFWGFSSIFCQVPNPFESVPQQNAVMSRVYAHMLIGDPYSAAKVAAEALQKDPSNQAIHQAHIKALAKARDEKQMAIAFGKYCSLFKFSPEEDRELCETMSWGIIAAGEKSDSPIVRLCALIAAFHGEDSKSVEHLRRGCSDSNSAVRAAAVQLVSHLRDTPLCDEIMRLYNVENIWKVRLEVIRAIGKMKIHEGRQELILLAASTNCDAEEKAAAIKSLIYLLEDIDRTEISQMAISDRAGLRLLACEVIGHLQNERDIDLLWQLSSDSRYEVRAAALRALGLLGIKEYDGYQVANLARTRCGDLNKDVAITAAWLLTVLEPGAAAPPFEYWLTHESPEVRQQAAAAISATGSYGISFVKEWFYKSEDPCVKINLALGLIQQGIDIQQACDTLFQEFTSGTRRWRWNEEGAFLALVPLKNSENDDFSMSMEEIHQMTQLEILNILAVLKYPKIEEAIQVFLKQKTWGISGLASAVLLTEGNSDALISVENLLDKSMAGAKIQAALILALWGRGEKAINILEQSYSGADRLTKERILEGIGRIGSLTSLPFLLERLQDPQQTLRLIAASAILQCLYH